MLVARLVSFRSNEKRWDAMPMLGSSSAIVGNWACCGDRKAALSATSAERSSARTSLRRHSSARWRAPSISVPDSSASADGRWPPRPLSPQRSRRGATNLILSAAGHNLRLALTGPCYGVCPPSKARSNRLAGSVENKDTATPSCPAGTDRQDTPIIGDDGSPFTPNP